MQSRYYTLLLFAWTSSYYLRVAGQSGTGSSTASTGLPGPYTNATGQSTSSSSTVISSTSSILTSSINTTSRADTTTGQDATTSTFTTSSVGNSTTGTHITTGTSTTSSVNSTTTGTDVTTGISSTNSSSLGTVGIPSIVYATITTSGSAGSTTEVVPFITGDGLSTAVPLSGSATVLGTVNPSGTEASSKAKELQTSIGLLIPIFQSYTKDPDPPGATSVIQEFEKIQPVFDDFLAELDPTGQTDPDCDSGNILTDIFSAVKCAVDEIEDTINNVKTEVENDFDDMTLTDNIEPVLTNLEDSLDDDGDGDDENTTTSSSQTSTSQTSTSQTTSQSSTSSTSSETCTSPTTITTSRCDIVCVTPTLTSGTVYPTNATLTTESCSTTCPTTTITTCSPTSLAPTTTTSTLTVSEAADACPLTSTYAGAYTTAYFDYAVSCAGNVAGCSGFNVPPAVTNPSITAFSVSASASGTTTNTTTIPVTSSSTNSSIATSSTSSPITSNTTTSNSITSTTSTPTSTTVSSTTSPSITSASTTAASPITSCTLSSQPKTVINSQTYSATIACACNDGWQAGVGTTVGTDLSTTYTCEAGTSTTIAVSTAAPAAPVITSCTLSQQPQTVIDSQTYSATVACACNGGEEAGVGTTVGSDQSTTYTCELGSSTTIAVSTAAPPYFTGTCDVHVWEGSMGEDEPIGVQLNITDGKGNLLASKDFSTSWGDTVSVPASDTNLPYEITVGFPETLVSRIKARQLEDYREALNKRICCGTTDPPTDPYEKWEVDITAGSTSWSSADTDSSDLPYCSVGGWDNGNFEDWLANVLSLGADQYVPNRQMDCRWSC